MLSPSRCLITASPGTARRVRRHDRRCQQQSGSGAGSGSAGAGPARRDGVEARVRRSGRAWADPRRRADLLALRAADARAVGEQRHDLLQLPARRVVDDVHQRSARQQLLEQRERAVHDVGVVVRLRDRRRDAVPAGGARRHRPVAGHRRHHGRRDVHPQLRPARLPARPDRRRGDDVRHAVLVGRHDLRERQRVRGRRSAGHRDDAAIAVLHLPHGDGGGRTVADRLRGRVEAVLPAAQHHARHRAARRGEGGQPEHGRRDRHPGADHAGRDAGADRVPALHTELFGIDRTRTSRRTRRCSPSSTPPSPRISAPPTSSCSTTSTGRGSGSRICC